MTTGNDTVASGSGPSSAPSDLELPSLDKYRAIDCEMVECRGNEVSLKGGRHQVLAKVGIVDYTGSVVYVSYVHVHTSSVVDWRSDSSGIRPGDLDNAPKFAEVVKKVKKIVEGKILVGHALFNDLASLTHQHPYDAIRDTALFYPLRTKMGITKEGQYPALRKLAVAVLGREIQKGPGHDPIEDARATMDIFLSVRQAYETALIKGEDCVAGVPKSHAKWYW